VYHPNLPEAAKDMQAISTFLMENGVSEVVTGAVNDDGLQAEVGKRKLDMVIALGGDGTMLRAGHLCAINDLPLLGINLGHFGFLTELDRTKWPEMLPRLFSGEFRIEERSMLRAEQIHQGKIKATWDVINDVVVCRGSIVRPIHLNAYVDHHLLASYVADGLIVATPTGSTAYALAVGGPILAPELHTNIIVPVAPHLSPDQAVVLPGDACVEIEVLNHHQAVLSIDGQTPVLLDPGDIVTATGSPYHLHFVRFKDPSYFYSHITRFMEHNPATNGDE
ncbi:MAG TPA: NAD(+)/NADH kinase, partial [Longilinea sp.]|nr:NAD(+)/NADH kinase [Longilinea sp.]